MTEYAKGPASHRPLLEAGWRQKALRVGPPKRDPFARSDEQPYAGVSRRVLAYGMSRLGKPVPEHHDSAFKRMLTIACLVGLGAAFVSQWFEPFQEWLRR